MAPSTPAPRRSHPSSGRRGVEYSTVVADEEDAKVAYLTADHLGSPRINTDRDGKVTARHDYRPFGEEILTAQRTTAQHYAADSIRKQFTGYERDGETGLDHAQSRMFAFASGRFSSPDDFLNDTSAIEPASWNLYIYVRNNPLNLVDPSGEQIYVGDITNAEDRDKLLKRVNATYGCASCVTIDDSGNLAVDVSNLSSDMKKATAFLTNAINSTEKFIQVVVRNNDPDILFGQSHPAGGSVPSVGPSGEPITSVTGGAQRRNSIRITLDFADEENIVAGDGDDIASFFDFVFAHEVSHFFPEEKKDPTTRGMRGDVDNPVNEIRAVQGRPLRAQYVYSTFGSMSMQQFGDAARNADGTVRRGSDGIEVENIRVFVWLKRHKP